MCLAGLKDSRMNHFSVAGFAEIGPHVKMDKAFSGLSPLRVDLYFFVGYDERGHKDLITIHLFVDN